MQGADGGSARRPFLRSMRAAVRAAGYEPGVVLPSSLAALAALETTEPVLAACLSGMSLTTSITSGQDLLLYRTLELPEDPASGLAKCSATSRWRQPTLKTSWRRRPRQLYYGGDWRGAGFCPLDQGPGAECGGTGAPAHDRARRQRWAT